MPSHVSDSWLSDEPIERGSRHIARSKALVLCLFPVGFIFVLARYVLGPTLVFLV